MNAPTKAIQNLGAFEKSTLVHQAQYCVTGASCPSPNSSATVAEVPEQVKKTNDQLYPDHAGESLTASERLALIEEDQGQ